ncbi:MAG: carboxypeptidase regulatory-like domain-containing protein [Blastocatellia bacterium]
MTSARLIHLTILGVLTAPSLLTALGQSVTGIITAKVTDTKGSRLAGATATISNAKIGMKKKAKTGDDGYFTVTGLRPGHYMIRVEMDGYNPSEKAVILEAIGRVNASPINLEKTSNSGGNQAVLTASVEIVLVPLDSGGLQTSRRQSGPLGELGSFPVIVPQLPSQAGSKGNQSTTTTAAASQSGDDTPNAGRLQVQSLSGERSDLVTNNQVKNLALNGRDIIEFLKLVPGIVSDFNGQISNPGGLDRFFINGTRGNQHELAIDGVSNVDTATNGSRHVTINPDAVAEIKVLTANYQAEYGKAAGGFIQIVTKSGTTELHGGAHFYHRHEGLNANNFVNNANGLPRPLYRYKTFGFDIGGPFYLPRFGEGGAAVKKIENLFFFVNQEFYRQLVPNLPRGINVPTPAERGGDFSKSLNQVGGRVFINDPTKKDANGNPLPCDARNTLPNPGGCFVHNGRLHVIPRERFFQDGRILGLYPLPTREAIPDNLFRNYVSQSSSRYPRSETVVRADYKLSEHTDLTGRVVNNTDNQSLPYGPQLDINPTNFALLQPNAFNNQNFDSWNIIFPRPGINLAFTLSHEFSPTVTGEFIFGFSGNRVRLAPEADKATLAANNLNFQLLFPDANRRGFLPNFGYGSLALGAVTTRFPETRFLGLPLKSNDGVLSFATNLTKVWNAHLVKIGAFIQESRREQSALVTNTGGIAFAVDRNNPLDTGHPYANALLGVYNRYEQANAAPVGLFRYRNVEGYIQDLWRVNDRLVLDLGLRLSWYQPQYDARSQASFFNPGLYDPGKAVRLYTPVCVSFNANGGCANRRAIDPVLLKPGLLPNASNTLPGHLIGLVVPGSGDLSNGFARAGQGYPRGGIDGRGVQWGPRFGFAYDLFGSGRSVLRGGFGLFYDRAQGGLIADMLRNPPTVVTPRLFYGRLDELNAARESFIEPPVVYGIARDSRIPTVYSFSLNYQQDIGFSTVLDVAYVGTLGRHFAQARNLNAVPYGRTFEPGSQDNTRFAGGVLPGEEPGLYLHEKAAGLRFSGRSALPVNFLRPYRGQGDILFYEFGGSSNYHSLQVSARRRFSRNLALSLAYTWSKAFTTTSDDFELTTAFNVRQFDYRLAAYDRTHVFAASYVYTLPEVSRYLRGHRLAKALFDGWQISGITQFSSGQPLELLNFSGGSSRAITGSSTEPARAFFLGNERLRPGPDGLQLNPRAFILAKPGSAVIRREGPDPWPRAYLRGPGINNFDISIFKNIPLGSEGRYLQLRLEMFNAFNHTQFSSINARGFNAVLENDDPYIEFPTRRGTYCNFLSGKFILTKAERCSNPNGPAFDRSRQPLGTLFGDYSNARDPRIIQLAGKLYF